MPKKQKRSQKETPLHLLQRMAELLKERGWAGVCCHVSVV